MANSYESQEGGGHSYICYARPNGKTCGHHNTRPARNHAGLTYCESCGRTKRASDLRAARGDVDKHFKKMLETACGSERGTFTDGLSEHARD